MKTAITIELYDDRIDAHVEVIVEADVYAGTADTWLEPGDPAELEVLDVLEAPEGFVVDTFSREVEEACWEALEMLVMDMAC